MFEQVALSRDRESVLESALRRLLNGARPGRAGAVIDFFPPEWAAARGVPLPTVGTPLDHGAAVDVPAADADADVAVDAGAAPDVDAAADVDADVEVLVAEREARVAAGAAQLSRARVAHGELARAAAEQARAVAAFARCRPVSLDRPDSEIGAAAAATRAGRPAALSAVSEWAVDEVAVALRLTGAAASKLLVDSLLLEERLPATLAALEAGRISWAHARVMTEVVAGLSDGVRSVAEDRLLARVGDKTHSQLRAAARRVVARLDAAAVARRVTQAIRDRRVAVYPGEDGMGTLSAVLPLPVARAVQDALAQYADAAMVPGDERRKAQRMVDCLVDLILRPGEHGLAPVQAKLTVVAAVQTLLGGDEPGEVDGDLVPAAMIRELAIALGLLPADTSPAAEAAPPVCEPTDNTGHKPEDHTEHEPEDGAAAPPEPEPTADPEPEPEPASAPIGGGPAGGGPAGGGPAGGGPAGGGPAGGGPAGGGPGGGGPGDEAADRARAALADLLSTWRLGGTALAHRPHIALVDELAGQLVALTDARGLRLGQPLGPPGESPGYRPEEALDQFVRLRDRRCRFPGCRARPIRCDLDHTVPWPWGPTSAANLCCLCRHHHRPSHQAPGWRLRGLPDGGLEWTTPTGQILTTRPPRFGADDDLPAQESAGSDRHTPGERAQRSTESSPPSSHPGHDDPPPF